MTTPSNCSEFRMEICFVIPCSDSYHSILQVILFPNKRPGSEDIKQAIENLTVWEVFLYQVQYVLAYII